MRQSRSASSLLALALVLPACATSLSSFQPAHVPDKGHVGAEVGWDVSAPVGTITRTIDAAETIVDAADKERLTDAQRAQLIEAGANLALVPPAAVMHAGIAFVPWSRWEFALRWSSGAWRVGVRRQLLAHDQDGLDLTVGLGLSRFAYDYPVDKVLEVVKLDKFVRWSVDVPLLIGTHGDWYRLWTGPRLLFSRFDSAMRLDLPATASGTPAETVLASVDGNAAFVGGQGGVALGYKHLFVVLELTVVQLISTGHLAFANQRQDVDLGGLVIYPGIGLIGEF